MRSSPEPRTSPCAGSRLQGPAREKVSVELKAPAGFPPDGRIVYHSPGRDSIALPYRRAGDSLLFELPRLEVYGVAELSPPSG